MNERDVLLEAIGYLSSLSEQEPQRHEACKRYVEAIRSVVDALDEEHFVDGWQS